MIIILSHYFWSLNKWEAHMQTVVIPTPFTWFGCKYPQIKADSLQLKHILFVYATLVFVGQNLLRKQQIKPHWMFALDNLLRQAVQDAITILLPGA